MLHGRGQNQGWPTSGPDGYITPAALGIPNASRLWTNSGLAQKWAGRLHNAYRLGGPLRCRARETSELPHNWGVSYIALAAWGVPNASERGTK